MLQSQQFKVTLCFWPYAASHKEEQPLINRRKYQVLKYTPVSLLLQNPQNISQSLLQVSRAPAEPPALSPMWKEGKERSLSPDHTRDLPLNNPQLPISISVFYILITLSPKSHNPPTIAMSFIRTTVRQFQHVYASLYKTHIDKSQANHPSLSSLPLKLTR